MMTEICIDELSQGKQGTQRKVEWAHSKTEEMAGKCTKGNGLLNKT
jgi:hypothetical protein